jgi:nucleotide-binding universal stress UspA family protein
MAYKEIVVFLDPTADSDNRLDYAISLARAQGARLIGVNASSAAAEANGPTHDRVEGLGDYFASKIKQSGIKGVFRQQFAPRYCDLILAPQPEFEARDLIDSNVPEEVLMSTGVPMLLFPYGWKPAPVGENIVIAWKSTREATRAVHDAMPFLEQAKKVVVFTFAPEFDIIGNEQELLVGHLAQHGVMASVSSWPATGDMSPAAALFACLDTQDADLIVAGAYGHSRLMEGLFGGVSRDLMHQPALPLLMSH